MKNNYESSALFGNIFLFVFLLIVLAACGDSGGQPPDNSPPVAIPGQDQNVFVGDLVTLNGGESNDPERDSLSFSWTLKDIPAGSGVSLSDPGVIQPTFVVDMPSTYIVELVVNDGKIDSAPATVAIVAAEIPNTTNLVPKANSGTDQIVNTGDIIQLDGSLSTDPDGDELIYNWSLTSVPTCSAATISSTTLSNPVFTVDLAGSYIVKLTVNDGQVDSMPDYVFIVADLGSFNEQVFSLGVSTFGITAGDYNGDTYLDVAVGIYDPNTSPSIFEGAIAVILGDGAGGLSTPTYYKAGSSPPRRLIARDINKDEIIDIIGTNEGYSGAPGNTISVLIGDGIGGFSSAAGFLVGEAPRSLIAEYIDQDNNLDLAVGNFSGDGVSIILGDGGGAFSSPTNFDVGKGLTSSVSVGDFNSDNFIDLALGHNGAHSISILIGDGAGGFRASSRVSVSGIFVSTVGDFNGDTFLDLAATRATTFGTPRADVVSIYTGDGSGNFSFLADFPTSSSVISMTTGDFNKDTFLDLAQVSLGDGVLTILFGDGTGGFLVPQNYPLGGITKDLVIGDFNKDDFLDIAVSHGGDISIFLWVP